MILEPIQMPNSSMSLYLNGAFLTVDHDVLLIVVVDKAQRENLNAHFKSQAIKIKHQLKNWLLF